MWILSTIKLSSGMVALTLTLRGRRIWELEVGLVYMLNSKTGLNRESLSYRKKM